MKKSKVRKTQPNKHISMVAKSQSSEIVNGMESSRKVSISYSGLLPPPGALQAYEQILPGLAERIVTMAEKSQDHKQSMERGALTAEVKYFSVGQNMAFSIALVAFGLAVYLAINGHDTVAGIIASSTIVGLATTFIKGSSKATEKPDTKKPQKPNAKS